MSKSKIVSALELGSSKITTLISQVNVDPVSYETSVNIVGVSSVESSGIRKGQIVDIEEAVEATISSVEAAERMAGYNMDSAYIGVGGGHVRSQNSHGVVAVSNPDGEITPDDVDRVIEAASAISLPASRELIHVMSREFIVDGEAGVKDPVGMSGIRLEVDTHLVTASSSALKNVRKAVNEVGIDILDFVFTGYASSIATLTKTEKELGCVLIDIGGGTTSIAVFVEGSLSYSAVLPVGSRNVTNDIAIGLRVSLENAEKIKLTLSSEKYKSYDDYDRKDLFDMAKAGVKDDKKVTIKTLVDGIIRPRINEIFSMVRIQLEKEDLINRIPSGAIVTGGGAEVISLVDAAKRTLSLPVRVGKPGGVGGLIDDIITPSYATPIGLVLYGAQNDQGTTNASFGKKLKIPTQGIAAKIIGKFKDLLP
ncbi:cell division protein FtsA [Candidatus Woesebacteria bacterium]|nr:cell division protein FtsA [Candidatus Woesebacteria bacterium]